jgi:hypothetical protein
MSKAERDEQVKGAILSNENMVCIQTPGKRSGHKFRPSCESVGINPSARGATALGLDSGLHVFTARLIQRFYFSTTPHPIVALLIVLMMV